MALIPTLNPPHRQIVTLEQQDRLDLIAAAIKSYEPELRIDDQEFNRGGVSYTVDTLRGVPIRLIKLKIFILSWAPMPSWIFLVGKNFEKLYCPFGEFCGYHPSRNLGFPYPRWICPRVLEQYVKASDNNHVILTSGRSILRVELENIDISSTELRKKLRNGF